MKYVNMRIPELGPLGETCFDASFLAIVSGSLVNSPGGGWVESVFTVLTHFFAACAMVFSRLFQPQPS
jgi:hypothetical protein